MKLFITVLLAVWLQSPALAAEPTAKPYRFTSDWFSSNTENWKSLLKEYEGKPNVRYLEVGVYEGRSFLWMLENILTHPSARATALDVFSGDLEKRFLYNLNLSGFRHKVTVVKGYSHDKLRSLKLNEFDVIYIDGSHLAKDVYVDTALSWGVLRPGGTLIFDDYMWFPHLPSDLTPKLAIDTFLEAFGDELSIVHKGFQLAVKKKSRPCHHHSCSTFAHFGYAWQEKKLYDLRTGKPVQITDEDRAALERFLPVYSKLRHDPALEHALGEFNAVLSKLSISIGDLR